VTCSTSARGEHDTQGAAVLIGLVLAVGAVGALAALVRGAQGKPATLDLGRDPLAEAEVISPMVERLKLNTFWKAPPSGQSVASLTQELRQLTHPNHQEQHAAR
jgi:hypothetical protein